MDGGFERLYADEQVAAYGPLAALGLPDPSDAPVRELRGQLSSSNLTIQVENQRDRVYAGSVNDGRNERSSYDAPYAQAHVSIGRIGADSVLQVLPMPGQAAAYMSLETQFAGATYAAPGPLRGRYPILPSVVSEAPALLVRPESRASDLLIQGSFLVRLYDIDFDVIKPGESRQSYRTGEIYSNQTGATWMTPNGVAADRDLRWAELRVTSGKLHLQAEGWDVSALFASAEVHLRGLVGGRGQDALLRGPTWERRVVDQGISLDRAVLAGEIQPSDGGVEAHLSGTASAVAVDGVRLDHASAVPTAGFTAAAPLMAIVALLLVGATAFWLVRVRRRRANVDRLLLRAEEAIGQQDYERALRLAKAASRSAPELLDAAAMHAIVLQKMDRPEEAAKLLKGLKAAGASKAMVSVLRAASLFQAGEGEEAALELENALVLDPLLRNDLQGTDLWDKALLTPRFRRRFGGEAASSGYV